MSIPSHPFYQIPPLPFYTGRCITGWGLPSHLVDVSSAGTLHPPYLLVDESSAGVPNLPSFSFGTSVLHFERIKFCVLTIDKIVRERPFMWALPNTTKKKKKKCPLEIDHDGNEPLPYDIINNILLKSTNSLL
jgi:hypothetical protein